MIRRKSTYIAWALFSLIIICTLVYTIQTVEDHGTFANVFAFISEVSFGLMAVVFALLAALIISQQPGQVIGWLLMVPSSLVVISAFVGAILDRYPTPPADPSFALVLAIWFDNVSWLLLIFPLLFIMLLFPTGKPPTPRWRWVLYAGLAMEAFLLLFAIFAPTMTLVDDESWGAIANPIGFLPAEIEFPMTLWLGALVGLTLACVASLFVRYRRSRGVERQQMKWLFYACGIFAAYYLLGFDTLEWSSPILQDVWNIIFVLTILGIPIAIAVAVLRYRLYDIDVIIRKTLVYSVVTGLLVLVYLGLVVLLQEIFAQVSGEQSPIAIVISTLVIAALFGPLRRRVQDGIDRRFYRRKYDANQALATFAKSARDEVDLERLATTLVSLVQETMQPEQVTLWLKENERPLPGTMATKQ